MRHNTHTHSFANSLKHIFSHILITSLAVGVAFSLPVAAQYVLYYWWPQVENSSRLLLITEITFAAALVLLFNTSRVAWSARRMAQLTSIASLVYAKEGESWFTRQGERQLHKNLPGAAEGLVLSLTGHDIFCAEASSLRQPLEDSYELRVMLLNPNSVVAKTCANSYDNPEDALAVHRREVDETINYLRRAAMAGKKVSLRFYDDPPLWKLVVIGDLLWVQHCRGGSEANHQPEYVFALQRENPGRGFFGPLYLYLLNQWSDPRFPDYNFDTDELVYRNADGNETARLPLRQ